MAENDSSRERILTEATRLFGQHGYAATSVREVVEAAGDTKPTLYYYSESKEALFREAIAAQLKGLGELIEHVVAAPGTPAERCACFLEAYVGGGQLNRDNVQLMVLANLGTERGQPRIALERAFAAEAARLTVLFDGFTDPEIAVSMLVGTANDLLFRALDGLPPPADYAQRVVRLLFAQDGR